ncbi:MULTISPECIES: MerR family transcriptional regulator [Bradyrhizobium]|uniref:MerR family transcriptional regulator n=1 Tax=Bradyrhizobium TaxID=374 RepID=UPI000A190573|nr:MULTISPECIES: MerR family transcriptional regulator [Bradyrhizobium]OSI68183.1 MerR family transcriptional regulator [Bradyrhizobium canariense]WOH62371.1 MerR family transcriptional regulator [Bradyrhizobium sp. BWC-3-1]
MDKAPDAFRTISEVAQELDIPQHVLRFWETRFSQIKPMKRSGGRRYYRPDDVDLLKGIRRLLYGEGYTIRGVQRILKEHGVKSVQGLADSAAAVSFGAIEDAVGASLMEPEEETGVRGARDSDDDDYQGEEEGIDFRFSETDDEEILTTFRKGGTPAAPAGPSAIDRERLGRVLAELIACREMLDQALKDA